MQCPRCQSPITSPPDASGALICPGCGAKLLTRAAAAARAGSKPGAAPEMPNPGSATLPPGTPLKNIPPRLDEGRATAAQIEAVLAELRALRSIQEDIVELLRARSGAPGGEPLGADALASMEETSAPPPVLRARHRKSVLLVDDDEAERKKAVAELEKAEVPVRAYGDGQAALEAIAQEKPDVIALELDLRGRMAGKDMINMIKATMEWVDIPIVLWTREAVTTQKEARQIHGADEVVPKSSGPAALLACVIGVFRR
jgi:CheY-like chemotaxis protein